MTDPLFDSRTVRFDLPLLFAGQAQKEGYVNEMAIKLDQMLHAAVEDVLDAPPAAPVGGQAWLVAPGPTGAWTGHAGQIAAFIDGAWLFVQPRDGMHVLNRATGQELRYKGGWLTPARPAAPSGGTTVDSEARASINALISALTVAGIIPPA